MSISVFEKIRQRLMQSSTTDGPRPDVAPAQPRVPFKLRVAKASAALSHVAIIALGGLALHTRPDMVTALLTPATTASNPRSLQLESAPAATASRANTPVPANRLVPATIAKPVSVETVQTNDMPLATARSASPIVPAVKRERPRETITSATVTTAAVTSATAPPAVTTVVTVAPPSTTLRAPPPKNASMKQLPLTVARTVVLPEPRLVVAQLPPHKALRAMPMPRRARVALRDVRVVEIIKVSDGDEALLATAKPRSKKLAAASKLAKTLPTAVLPPTPLVKWAALTPEQRAEANATVKKTTPYTVAVTWTEEQIAAARAECGKLLKSVDLVTTNAEPVKEGACGAPAPVNVRSVGKPKVQMHPATMMTCPMAAALDEWISEKVQPAAIASFGSPVARLLSASSYSCRNRYGSANTPLSEHALVNALDLSGFILVDGRTVRVQQDWGPVARDAAKKPLASHDGEKADVLPVPIKVAIAVTATPGKAGLSMLGGASMAKKISTKSEPKLDAKHGAKPKAADDTAKQSQDKPSEKSAGATTVPAKDAAPSEEKTPIKDVTVARREFLHRVHAGACDVFGTVLGPEANDAHRDHLHLDMKARKRRAYCQ